MVECQYVLYGLKSLHKLICRIIQNLQPGEKEYDIRMILSEAISNAYFHGNASDESKPIYVRYRYEDKKVRFEIQDRGYGFTNACIPRQLPEEKLLDAHGRGLFLIHCYADKVEMHENVLVVEKRI